MVIRGKYKDRAGARPLLTRRVLVLLLGTVLFGVAARGSELEELNPDLAAQLHLKVLSYDRSLQARSRGRLVLGILYRGDRDESERARGLMQTAFQERASKSGVQGMSLSVMSIAVGDLRTLQKRLQDAGVSLLYLTPGLEDLAGSIHPIAQALRAPTLAGRRSLIDAGAAIAVITKDDKPGIVVNLPAAKALGMDLDTLLLRLAEVKR
jgi:hypothetical protein